MIISVYKPIKEKKIVVMYEILSSESIYNIGSQRYKVIYKCDKSNCKTPDKLYSISREHLNEKRSKTVNDKVQICRVCQTTGSNNPRYGDNRTWDELYDKETSKKLRKNLSDRSIGDKNPSKKDYVKIKKGQKIINFESVKEEFDKINYKLNSIIGDNKFSSICVTCDNDHEFTIKYVNFNKNKCLCRYCYYDSIRIPFEQIKEFEKYSRVVRSLTRGVFNRNKKIIDPNGLKEQESKKYHIDHIYSVSDGFLNDIDPKIISSVCNLRVITQVDNLKKGKKSDITLEKLLEKIKQSI